MSIITEISHILQNNIEFRNNNIIQQLEEGKLSIKDIASFNKVSEAYVLKLEDAAFSIITKPLSADKKVIKAHDVNGKLGWRKVPRQVMVLSKKEQEDNLKPVHIDFSKPVAKVQTESISTQIQKALDENKALKIMFADSTEFVIENSHAQLYLNKIKNHNFDETSLSSYHDFLNFITE